MDLINSDNLELDLQTLGSSGKDLEDVANYCELNYTQAEDKKEALEMTKDYAVQSLASVAYQINNLAFNFLAALEGADFELQKLDQNVKHLEQKIEINDEKMARKQIGFLAVSKVEHSSFKIVAPLNQEPIPKASRMKKIDYTELDHIGHGVAPPQPQTTMNSSLNDSMSNLSVSSGASGFSGTIRYPGSSTLKDLSKYKDKYGTMPNLKRGSVYSQNSLYSLQSLFQKSPRSISRPTEMPPSPPVRHPKVKVVYPYSPRKYDELSLKEGDFITILHKNDDGWWEGINGNGHQGVFPSNYVAL